MSRILVTVVTPQKTVIRREVDEIVLPGVVGEIGIMPMHTPFVSILGVGMMTLRQGQDVRRYVLSGGFVEVAEDQALILTDTCEVADEIDLARAKKSLASAELQMNELNGFTPEYEQALQDLKLAQARLDVSSRRDF